MVIEERLTYNINQAKHLAKLARCFLIENNTFYICESVKKSDESTGQN